MARPDDQILTRDRAWSCIMLNVATAGTGSMRAGRMVTGVCQLALALAGTGLIGAWMFISVFRAVLNYSPAAATPSGTSAWLWKLGVACFIVSWTWTFFTCVDLFWQARAQERRARLNVPPKLAEVAGKKSANA